MEAPEIKPNTILHVGISGGKDSTAVLLWMLYESGIDRSKLDVTFCDTGNEHDWTYAHVRMLHEKVHPIRTLKPELLFFPLALKKRRFPSTKARFCTEFLKIYPTEDHIRKLKLRGLEPIAVSGVRADESEERRHLPEWDFSGNLFLHAVASIDSLDALRCAGDSQAVRCSAQSVLLAWGHARRLLAVHHEPQERNTNHCSEIPRAH